jgi:hypothetical protein
MSAATGLKYVRGLATTDLYVLDPRNNPVPIRVILELGDNAVDRVLLESEAGRQMLAEALATAVRENTPPPTRYDQGDYRISYSGAWTKVSTSSASGGSFCYAKTAGASATVAFIGTSLTWVAKKSSPYGLARVTLDDNEPVIVDLHNPTVLWRQRVWNTGKLPAGLHTVKIEWLGQASVPGGGIDANVDAFDIVGTLARTGGSTDPSATRFEQTNTKIGYSGPWTTFSASGASGGTYRYAALAAAAEVRFTGTRLDWIATTGTTQGIASISVDGGEPVAVNLYSTSTLRQQKVWSTGELSAGAHRVTIAWTGEAGASGGTRVNIDALDVTGTLDQAPVPATYQQSAALLTYSGSWTAVATASASGASFKYAKGLDSSVTVKFTGSRLVWLAKKSPPYGFAKVTLDGGDPVMVDLYSASVLWQQKAWDTGVLPEGSHTVVIEWTGTPSRAGGGVDMNVDAFQIMGSLN